MIIFQDEKIIFIHIPKCGGTSISFSLECVARWNDLFIGGTEFGEYIQKTWAVRHGLKKHGTATEVKSIIGNDLYGSYIKFVTVRDPFSRFISAFNFLMSNVNSGRDWILPFKEYYKIDFDLNINEFLRKDFISDLVEQPYLYMRVADLHAQRINQRLFLKQSLFIDLDEINAGRFYFIKLEEMENLALFLEKLGFRRKFQIIKTNQNFDKKFLLDDLSLESKLLIQNLYQDDFDMFGYEKLIYV